MAIRDLPLEALGAIIRGVHRPKSLQRVFVLEYMKDGNGTQAAIRAGYSDRTAAEQAARLLTKVNVRAFLDQQRAKVEPKLEMTRDEYIARMPDSFANMREIRRMCHE